MDVFEFVVLCVLLLMILATIGLFAFFIIGGIINSER